MAKYDKGEGTGHEGVEFQISLLTVAALNASQNLTDWRLSTENTNAGKFDDLILEYPQGTVLLQAKHKKNKTTKEAKHKGKTKPEQKASKDAKLKEKMGERRQEENKSEQASKDAQDKGDGKPELEGQISFDDLMTDHSSKNEFSLPKYFLSYQIIKKNFKAIKNLIICTNADVQKSVLDFLDIQSITPEDILHFGDDDYKLYKFKHTVLPQLEEKAKVCLKNNFANKGIDASVITEENLREFLERLQFYCNYPSGDKLARHIEQLLARRKLPYEMTFSDIYSKMKDWYEECVAQVVTRDSFEASLR